MSRSLWRSLAPWLVVASIIVSAIAPHTASAQGEPGYAQLVRIDYLERTVSRERVAPGEPFHATVRAKATLVRRLNIPWEVIGEYQALGVHRESRLEVVLGQGVSQTGPFGDLQPGDSLSYEQQVDMVFPPEAPLGHYTLYVKPVRVSPWFLWLALEAFAPERAQLGEVELVPAPPPTPVPVPTATPPPSPPQGTPWPVIAGAVLVAALLAAAAGWLLGRRSA